MGQSDADHQVGVLRNDPVPQSDSRLCAPHRGVENRPGALHFPDRGLPQFRSAGVDFLGQPRQQLWMAAQPLQLPRPLIRRLSRDRRPARSATRRRCADWASGPVFVAGLHQQRSTSLRSSRTGRPAHRRSAGRRSRRNGAGPLYRSPRTPRTQVTPHPRRRRGPMPTTVTMAAPRREARPARVPRRRTWRGSRQSDARHRRHVRTRGPPARCDLAHHLLFDDLLVASHPPAVKHAGPPPCGARGVGRRQG